MAPAAAQPSDFIDDDFEPGTYRRFLHWCTEHDITITGVRSLAQPNRGRGIFATRPIKEGELLVRVPAASMLTVPRGPPDTVHGRLAARLLAGSLHGGPYEVWRGVMPDRADVEACMPLAWDDEVAAGLPDGAKPLLQAQRKKFDADWAMLTDPSRPYSAARLGIDLPPDELRVQYLHAWLLVNTRCFYWDIAAPRAGSASGRARASRKKPPDAECMAMCPFLDFFNHSHDGIQAQYNRNGYFLTTTRAYAEGEEVLFSYGAFANDALLVEYGFAMDGHVGDAVTLDAVVLASLTEDQRDALGEANMLGNYTLAADGTVCHRTQCAMRVAILPRRKFERFVRGESDGEAEQKQVDIFVLRLLDHFQKETVDANLAQMRRLSDEGKRGAVSCLHRWEQIRSIVEAGLKRRKTTVS